MTTRSGGNTSAEFERAAIPQLSYLFRTAVYLVKDPWEAEDLVQETYLRAFRFFHQFRPGTNCRAWLLTILHRLFINRYRENLRRPQTVPWEDAGGLEEVMAETGTETDVAGLSVSQSLDDEVERALRKLSAEFRMAVLLVDVAELSYEQAAQVIGSPLGTLRSRVARGRCQLRAALQPYLARLRQAQGRSSTLNKVVEGIAVCGA